MLQAGRWSNDASSDQAPHCKVKFSATTSKHPRARRGFLHPLLAYGEK
jgi:hypothetical protein